MQRNDAGRDLEARQTQEIEGGGALDDHRSGFSMRNLSGSTEPIKQIRKKNFSN